MSIDNGRYEMAKFFRKKFRRVLIDVDTQLDLIFGEQVCLLNSETDSAEDSLEALLCRFRRLFAWARVHKIPVISTSLLHHIDGMDHVNDNIPYGIEDLSDPPKIHFTLMPLNIQFGSENRMDLPQHLLADYQQVIFEKRLPDPFEHPRADRMLTDLKADNFIVFGMGTETAVKATVLGLLNRRKKVTLLHDATAGDTRQSVNMAIRQMQAKGALLADTQKITGRSRFDHKTQALQRMQQRALSHSKSQ